MSTAPKSRSRLIVILCVAAALAAALAGGMFASRMLLDSTPAVPEDVSLLEPARPLPQVRLIDDAGEPFGLEQLRGQWSLLFFGFTHCPDICPNTLGILNSVHTRLQQSGQAPGLQMVFVSVDPRRDDPTALRQYVHYFDKDFVGVTGEIEQLKRLTGALYIPFAYTDNPDGGYTVEHSAALVLVNPQGQARAYFTPPHAPEKLAADLTAAMRAGS